jgi:acyl-[acyl carrier protein]--UDP-N-acetylglucosamine O-acyltransferase
VNAQNLKRCGFGDNDIQALKQAFREIFNGENLEPNVKAIKRYLKRSDTNRHIRKLIESLQSAGPGRP